MKNWFYNPESHFEMWGTSHLYTILFISLVLTSLFIFRKSFMPYRKFIRITAGWALIIGRLSLDLWYVLTKQWSLTSSLPLELCSIATILCGIMLLTKSYRLFEVFYFIALGGASQAILTPDLYFDFPQFRFLQFFIDHLLLLMAPLILLWLYHFKITLKSLVKSFIFLNIIAGGIFTINILLDANYMFLRQKPTSGSLLDFLGPYPYYIFSLEIVVLLIFAILYLPFIWKSNHNKIRTGK